MPFTAAPVGDMFQQKLNKIFKDLPNMFGTADDILIVGFMDTGHNHDTALRQVMQICSTESLKLNKDKCHFKCTRVPFFGQIVSRHGVQQDHKMLCTFTQNATPKIKNTFAVILGIMNYLREYSTANAEVCDSLKRLTSMKTKGS